MVLSLLKIVLPQSFNLRKNINLVNATTIGNGVCFCGNYCKTINLHYVHMGTVFHTDFTHGERENIFITELNSVFSAKLLIIVNELNDVFSAKLLIQWTVRAQCFFLWCSVLRTSVN